MKSLKDILDEAEKWASVEYAYGTSKIIKHKSKSDALTYVKTTHGEPKSVKLSSGHYEVGGRHLVTKVSNLKNLGYETVHEDEVPVNNASAGGVEGLGDNPPVDNRKKKKKLSVILAPMQKRPPPA